MCVVYMRHSAFSTSLPFFLIIYFTSLLFISFFTSNESFNDACVMLPSFNIIFVLLLLMLPFLRNSKRVTVRNMAKYIQTYQLYLYFADYRKSIIIISLKFCFV